jgi:putative Holliday junction resolvase
MNSLNSPSILALDVGEKRIGVATATLQARLSSPLTTLQRSEATPDDIERLLLEHQAVALVLGLPRGLDGQHTGQTTAVENFAKTLEPSLDIPLYWQDEAVTSVRAEEELQARGKPYRKEDIDALSATYILEDFMRDHPEVT